MNYDSGRTVRFWQSYRTTGNIGGWNWFEEEGTIMREYKCHVIVRLFRPKNPEKFKFPVVSVRKDRIIKVSGNNL